LCRADALALYELRPQLRALGVEAVVMVHEDVAGEVAAFRRESWPDGKIFYDRLKYVYRVLGDGGIPTGSIMKAAFNGGGKEYVKVVKELKAKGKGAGNAKGSFTVFGGVVFFEQGGRVAFVHKEEGLGDRMDFKSILEQARGLQTEPNAAAAADAGYGAAAVAPDPASSIGGEGAVASTHE